MPVKCQLESIHNDNPELSVKEILRSHVVLVPITVLVKSSQEIVATQTG